VRLGGLDDEELMLTCRDAKDPEVLRRAVSILAERHQEALRRFVYQYVRSRETAEDLCQEAFIRIYRHARGYKEIARVKTWLYRIARNLALNAIRDKKRKPARSLDAALEAGAIADPTAREDSDPVREAQRRDLKRRVRAAVDTLPEHYRGTLLLCDLEGLTYQEAADVLGTKVGTVRSRLFRARARLSEIMGPKENPSHGM
jgi:RNA polymerase sigma-70 factor (ECF subfamily)